MTWHLITIRRADRNDRALDIQFPTKRTSLSIGAASTNDFWFGFASIMANEVGGDADKALHLELGRRVKINGRTASSARIGYLLITVSAHKYTAGKDFVTHDGRELLYPPADVAMCLPTHDVDWSNELMFRAVAGERWACCQGGRRGSGYCRGGTVLFVAVDETTDLSQFKCPVCGGEMEDPLPAKRLYDRQARRFARYFNTSWAPAVRQRVAVVADEMRAVASASPEDQAAALRRSLVSLKRLVPRKPWEDQPGYWGDTLAPMQEALEEMILDLKSLQEDLDDEVRARRRICTSLRTVAAPSVLAGEV
jgi:hypothetical protein